MEQRRPRLRWLVVWVFAVVWMAVVVGRLSYLQLFCYGEYFTKAQHQQQRVFEISPKRGVIYDRKGRELAISLPMDSVFGDPAEITDAEMVARLLAPALGMPADDLETKIREAHTPVRLAKKLSPETVQRIQDMNLRGVFFQKENRRVYPQHELAAHVLGYVDVDEKGNGGIEYSLDKQIRGRPGKMMVMADGRRRWYDRTESAADPGASVVLTIDQTIQYIAEKELERAIEETHANNGTVVVQDPNTGQLLAVAVRPTFDPNNPGSFPDEVRMDRAVICRLRTWFDIQSGNDDGRDRKWSGAAVGPGGLPDGLDPRGGPADSRLASVWRAERAGSAGAFERRGFDQGCAAGWALRSFTKRCERSGSASLPGSSCPAKIAGCCGRWRIGRRVRLDRLRLGRK